MQLLLGAGKVPGGEFGPGQLATVQGLFDVRQFFLARLVQYKIGDLLGQTEGAWMADAQAQAPEIRCAELGLDVLQAVVAAIAVRNGWRRRMMWW